jgi:hypothetical protein
MAGTKRRSLHKGRSNTDGGSMNDLPASLPPPATSDFSGRTNTVVGQSTAVLAVAAAVTYGAGILTVGLKLWLLKLPATTSVLGLLPHSFIITTAFGEVVVPTILIGGIFGLWIDHINMKRVSAEPAAKPWPASCDAKATILWVAIASVLLSGIAVGSLELAAHVKHVIPGATYPWWAWLLVGFVVNTGVIHALVYALKEIYTDPDRRRWYRRSRTIGCAAIASIWLVSSVSASLLLPPVTLYGSSFVTPTGDGSTTCLIGNLIGTDGQYLYVATFHQVDTAKQPPTLTITSRAINVIPLSTVRREIIGQRLSCTVIDGAPCVTPRVSGTSTTGVPEVCETLPTDNELLWRPSTKSSG